MKIYQGANYINTSESYSNSIFFGNGNLIVPYINLELMEGNPLTGKQNYIDYAYFVFFGVADVEFIGEGNRFSLVHSRDIQSEFIEEHINLETFNGKMGAEVKIRCKDLQLFLPNMFKYASIIQPFVFRKTPNFEPNIDQRKAASFLTGVELLEEEIISFLGKDHWRFEYV